nr:type II toxin-antitoxin system VapC family toxin [uncultured Sphingosinicella sp.]
MILLDTHVLLWFTLGNQKLGTQARQTIEDAMAQAAIAISVITFWEVSLLVSRRRLDLGATIGDWVSRFRTLEGVVVTDIQTEIAVAAGELPGSIHGDPADRMIIATARTWPCPLLTADRTILDYGAAGHVSAIDARV